MKKIYVSPQIECGNFFCGLVLTDSAQENINNNLDNIGKDIFGEYDK